MSITSRHPSIVLIMPASRSLGVWRETHKRRRSPSRPFPEAQKGVWHPGHPPRPYCPCRGGLVMRRTSSS